MQHKIQTRYDCNVFIGLGAWLTIGFLFCILATIFGYTEKDELPFASALVIGALGMAMGLLLWRVAYLVRPPR